MTKQLDLSPEKSATIMLPDTSETKVTIVLKTSAGIELARFVSPIPLPRVNPPEPPAYVNTPDNKLTLEEIYLMAQKYDRALDRNQAREYYNRVLKIDSLQLSALRDLAILDFEGAQYDNAAKMLAKALE
jgi:tetratricopeptide (TPR) repeat protein